MSEEFLFAIYTGALILAIKLAALACGYFSVRMGYHLISAGVEGKFQFKAEWKGAKADLASVSPGLLFVLLGCWLCGFALYVDKPIYFERTTSSSVSSSIGKMERDKPPIPNMPGLPETRTPSSAKETQR